jgi:hypothetical protein
MDTFFVKKEGVVDEPLEPFMTLFSSFQYTHSVEAFSRLLLFPLQCPKYSSQFSTEDSDDSEEDQEDINNSIRTLLQVIHLMKYI